jgi:hypothetical protein
MGQKLTISQMEVGDRFYVDQERTAVMKKIDSDNQLMLCSPMNGLPAAILDRIPLRPRECVWPGDFAKVYRGCTEAEFLTTKFELEE